MAQTHFLPSVTEEAARPPYRYLKSIDENHLRILTLKRCSDFHGEIECSLSTSVRDGFFPYEALSYCWGSAEQPRSRIILDGQTLVVREGLASALRHLRSADTERFLWVDAICIDQSHEDEKGLQVRKMGETYEKASKVVVWLGPPSEENKSALAVKAIAYLGLKYCTQTLNQVRSEKLSLPARIEGLGPDVYIPAIRKLLQREWFKRLWVCSGPSCNALL